MLNSPLTELRLYEVEPGRAADMKARFHGPLKQLFLRHGIEVSGAWISSYGPRAPLFVYLMRWSSLEARDAAWNAFYADPEWHEARTQTNRGSELVERFDLNFLRDIIPLKTAAIDASGDLELLLPRVKIGAGAQARQWLLNEAPQVLDRAGAQLLGAYECVTGDDLPRTCLFVQWQSPSARAAAISALEVAPLGRADRYLLHAL